MKLTILDAETGSSVYFDTEEVICFLFQPGSTDKEDKGCIVLRGQHEPLEIGGACVAAVNRVITERHPVYTRSGIMKPTPKAD